MDLTHLCEYGWMQFENVTTDNEMLGIAKQLGSVVKSPTGEVIKQLKPIASEDAKHGTLSHQYGKNAFPFHTDTAFWAVPARYVVLRVTGDFRRPTRVVKFSEVACFHPNLPTIIKQSIWSVTPPAGNFYCSLFFRHGTHIGCRLDFQCMSPVNQHAESVKSVLLPLLSQDVGIEVNWAPGRVLVIDNWASLHARGRAPEDEGLRHLKRIYVRGSDELGS